MHNIAVTNVLYKKDIHIVFTLRRFLKRFYYQPSSHSEGKRSFTCMDLIVLYLVGPDKTLKMRKINANDERTF